MTRRTTYLLALLLVTVIPTFGNCTGSSPTWTSTPDFASVNTCLTNASRNDTINVSAGSATWASTLTVTKGITLAGAGVGSTTITSNGSTILIQGAPDATAIGHSSLIFPCAACEHIRITGFTFDGGGAGGEDILIDVIGASGITGTKPYCCYIIGNNKFQNTNTGSSNGAIQADGNSNGQLRGVIYSNTFDKCNVVLRLFSANDTGESVNTAFNNLLPALGSADDLYFENNTIQFSSSYAGGNPGWTEIGQGSRSVLRYNTWNLANATSPQEVNDIHGYQNWNGIPGGGQTGTMVTERYGNSYSNMGTFRWFDDRGGIGMFYDNILTGSGANSFDIYGESAPGSCPSDISPTPTNYNPTIYDTYVWNNTLNASNVLATMFAAGNPIHCTVAENSNFTNAVHPTCTSNCGGWWNLNGSCTTSACAAGIGTGTSAPTGTCTTGVGFWVASTPGATTSSSVIQNAKFYVCTATNTWTLFYQPYTYPHPLISGSSSPAVTISPTPVSFPNQAFGVPSSPSLTVTVTNTGTATLTLSTPYFTISGTNAADFSGNLAGSTCTNGGSVSAGLSCLILMNFTPSLVGAETATLNINGNASGSTTINGTGALSNFMNGTGQISGAGVIKP